jgi:hypothetical protein
VPGIHLRATPILPGIPVLSITTRPNSPDNSCVCNGSPNTPTPLAGLLSSFDAFSRHVSETSQARQSGRRDVFMSKFMRLRWHVQT